MRGLLHEDVRATDSYLRHCYNSSLSRLDGYELPNVCKSAVGNVQKGASLSTCHNGLKRNVCTGVYRHVCLSLVTLLTSVSQAFMAGKQKKGYISLLSITQSQPTHIPSTRNQATGFSFNEPASAQ